MSAPAPDLIRPPLPAPVEATGLAKVTLLPLVSIAPLLPAVSESRSEMSFVTLVPYCSVPLEIRIEPEPVPDPSALMEAKFSTPASTTVLPVQELLAERVIVPRPRLLKLAVVVPPIDVASVTLLPLVSTIDQFPVVIWILGEMSCVLPVPHCRTPVLLDHLIPEVLLSELFANCSVPLLMSVSPVKVFDPERIRTPASPLRMPVVKAPLSTILPAYSVVPVP